MKKGCFLSFIMVFTLIVIAVVYFIKHNKGEISKFGKERVLDLARNEFNEKLNKLKSNTMKDSLKSLSIKEYESIKKYDFKESMRKFGDFADKVKDFTNDNLIDSTEFEKLKLLVEEHARSKKNRN